MDFKGGPKEAAKLLASLDLSAQEKILDLIALKDPQMAEFLRNNRVTFEDLSFLSVKMLSELLKEIDLFDLSLGLRVASSKLKNHILSNVSSGTKKEIESVLLGPPQSLDKINESISKVMSVVLVKMTKGEIVLREDGETYV